EYFANIPCNKRRICPACRWAFPASCAGRILATCPRDCLLEKSNRARTAVFRGKFRGGRGIFRRFSRKKRGFIRKSGAAKWRGAAKSAFSESSGGLQEKRLRYWLGVKPTYWVKIREK